MNGQIENTMNEQIENESKDFTPYSFFFHAQRSSSKQ